MGQVKKWLSYQLKVIFYDKNCCFVIFTYLIFANNYFNVFQHIGFHWSTLSLITTMLFSIEGHSVADFDTQSAFNRWRTTTFKLKASLIQSTLYDYHLDGPSNREPNLKSDNWTLIPWWHRLIPRPKKVWFCQHFFFFFFFFSFFNITIGKTGNSRSLIRFRYFIFEISGKPSYVLKLFYESCAVVLPFLLSISTKS